MESWFLRNYQSFAFGRIGNIGRITKSIMLAKSMNLHRKTLERHNFDISKEQRIFFAEFGWFLCFDQNQQKIGSYAKTIEKATSPF
jgi:hypothetical protein